MNIAGSLSAARRHGLPATLTKDAWDETVQHFGGMCAYCRRRPPVIVEHFVPIRHGGGTTPGNCLPSCRSCNLTKKQKLPADFADDFGKRRVRALAAFLRRRSIGADHGEPPPLKARPPREIQPQRDKPWQVRVDKDEDAALFDLRVFLGTPEHPATAGAAFRWLLNGYRTGRLVDHDAKRALDADQRRRKN